jgi:sigma54-dependent transcription regulator
MDNQAKALAAIKEASGTELGEYSVDEFISHHLEELSADYWKKHLGTTSPTTESVIGLLVLRSKWDDSEVYDFTLPEEVTDYVVSVSFDDDGEIEDIAMES